MQAKAAFPSLTRPTSFLEARTDGQPLDEDFVKIEMLFILLAGADTTGTLFQSVIYLVLSHPRVYSTLMSELDAATTAGALSAMPQYDEVMAHCPYMVACVREALRLVPPAKGYLPRLVSKGGVEVCGRHIPEGTELASSSWVVQRDKAIYGEDSWEFKPERWLDEEAAKEYGKFNLAFGYGARACLGKDIATMEMFKGPLQASILWAINFLSMLLPLPLLRLTYYCEDMTVHERLTYELVLPHISCQTLGRKPPC